MINIVTGHYQREKGEKKKSRKSCQRVYLDIVYFAEIENLLLKVL